MFRRLHRKDEYVGAGIGLAVCQRIVDQCDGAMSVESTLGEGSTFTVTLPIHEFSHHKVSEDVDHALQQNHLD